MKSSLVLAFGIVVFSSALAGPAFAWGHSSGTKVFFTREQNKADKAQAEAAAQPMPSTQAMPKKHKKHHA